MKTTELDTKQEKPSSNGHDDTWQTFDSDAAFLQHILSKKPEEKLVEVPEWNAKVLCRALNAQSRIQVDAKAYREADKTTNYGRVPHWLVIYGCYNPTTGNRIFTEEHADLLQEQDGGAVARLAYTVLQLSHMLGDEDTKKN